MLAASSTPTGDNVTVEGGYPLSGGWMYCSGMDNCPWIILAVNLPAQAPDERPAKGYLLARAAEFGVEDVWQVVGLAGTGSKTVFCEDMFIPAHRFLSLEDTVSGNPPGIAHNPGPLYRILLFAQISCSLVAPIIGMAQGALDAFVETTTGRVTRGAALSSPSPMASLPSIQLKVGEAAACVDAARLLVDRDLKDIMATVGSGRELTVAQRARNKGDWGFAAKLAVQAIDTIFQASGGGLFSKRPIQRFWRDAHAGAAHISMNWDSVGALYGRVTLGLSAGPAQF